MLIASFSDTHYYTEGLCNWNVIYFCAGSPRRLDDSTHMSESDSDCGVRMMKRIVTLRGKMRRDKFFFPVQVNQLLISDVVLDTGAFDFVVSERIATKLGLQRHKSVVVRGVSGSAKASTSRCDLTIGHKSFHDVPCVIMKGLPYDALFGLRFFVDHKYQLMLDPARATLDLLR